MNKYLVKLADHLDKKGLYKEADYLDWIIKKAIGPDLMVPEGGGGPIKPDPKDQDPALKEKTRIKSLDEIIRRGLFKHIFLHYKLGDGKVSIKRENPFQEELYKAWTYLFQNTKRPSGTSRDPFNNGEPNIIDMSNHHHTSFQKFIIFINNKGIDLQVVIQARDDFSNELVVEASFNIKNTEKSREHIAQFVAANKLEKYDVRHK
ncbi:hypothetical protein N9W84_00945 [bacterium]|nr:hypothetical protein [bacterium]